MRRLNAKSAITKPLIIRISNIVKERKLIDRMSAGEVLNFLNVQSLMWGGKDHEAIKYALKKRVPELRTEFAHSESFIRGLLNTIVNI
jgi:hypothetical protein